MPERDTTRVIPAMVTGKGYFPERPGAGMPPDAVGVRFFDLLFMLA
jgi:hypothetical protein